MNTGRYPEQLLFSYGMEQATSYVCRPARYEDVLECINYANENGYKICPSGSRLSFSNVCLIDKQISLDMRGLNKLLHFDEQKGEVKVQAGMLTTQLLRLILPKGFTLIGLTGSLGNTIGGEIGNDVNGKDCWKSGNFGENVIAFSMATAAGEIVFVDRQQEPELCNAVIGGLGLIGVLLEVTLKLQRVPSFMLNAKSVKNSDIAELVETMNNLKPEQTDFAYCWTDPYAPEKYIGRGICETATFTDNSGNYPVNKMLEGFNQKRRIGPFLPDTFWSIFRKIDFAFTYRWSGYAKFFLVGNSSKQIPFTGYQYPMVKYLPQWNLRFYPWGFREWQILIPVTNFERAYMEILRFCRESDFTPYVCAVRKHKKQAAYLSFAGDGFSFTINYALHSHNEHDRLKFEAGLLNMVLSNAGKIYLGKFPFIGKADLVKMYPGVHKYLQVKSSTDSANLFWSDAAEILFK